jgi:FkbM family methyltransferase
LASARSRVAELLLNSPVRFRSLRNVPILGSWIHGLSYRVLPADEKVWARVRQGRAKGIWLELNPRTGQDYASGCAEPAVQEIMANYLGPGMVFYDLGANIGLFSLLAARLVTESGKVFSFEPDHQTAVRLRRNIEKNAFENVCVIEAGVGAVTARSVFLPADANSPDRGVGRFASPGEDTSGDLRECYALDDFVRDTRMPDGIKCDVEGAELEVFQGAQHILSSRRPWIIFEIHSAMNGNALRDLCRNLGYKLQNVDENHFLALP